ncbi:MAG: HAD family hydrolase, partial [Bacteroidetes bacterium]
SYLTQLWNEDTFQKNAEPEASRLANTIGKYFTFAILTIALTTLAYWLWTDSRVAFNAFTAVLIIACPCAVALSIPFTFGNAIRLWAPFGFYVKNTRVVEELAGIDAVVFDKTGTITNAGKSEIRYVGTALTPAEKAAVRSVAHASSHPVSRLIDGFFADAEYLEVSDYEEITGQGVRGHAGGMYIEIGSEKMAQPSSENAGPDDAFRAGRTGTRLWVNGREVGRFLTQNHYRRGFEKVVEAWKNRFPVYLLSGDNDHERPILEPLLGKDHLFFGQSPKDKLEFIRRLQETGKKVLMLGDGLNDAGALRQSDVGIVVSENTNNFTPACDAILDARYFDYLARFHDFARANLRWVYASYGLAFVYNVVGLSFAVQGALSPVVAAILMPLSSISIVIFGVAGSTFWAKKILKDKTLTGAPSGPGAGEYESQRQRKKMSL